MLQRIARMAIRAPKRIIVIALLVMVATGIFGIPVTKSLSAGGFQDPTSESAKAAKLLIDKFGQGDMQLILSVTSDGGMDSAESRAVGTELVSQLQASPHVVDVTSAWTAPPTATPALVSKDGKTGLIVAGITGGETNAQKYTKELTERLVHDRDGVTVRAGGEAMIYVQINGQTEKDLLLMESIAIPLSFIVLVWVFGGLLAAALPLAVGGFAILGSMAVLRAITFVTDVSIFALNLSVAMGLALAIDYTLLIISRYRDELAAGSQRDEALIRTMATAGRTVLFSAMTVALSMVAMVLFPMYFLKSFAYAGIAVVAFAAVAAIVVAPAAIVLLGDRLDALDMRRLLRRMLGRPEPTPKPVEDSFWYRSHQIRYAPVDSGRARDHRAPASARRTVPRCEVGIPRRPRAAPVAIGARGRRPVAQRLRRRLGARRDRRHPRRQRAHARRSSAATPPTCPWCPTCRRCPRRRERSSSGRPAGPPSAATGLEDGSAFLTVGSDAPLFSDASETQLDRLHAVSRPDGQRCELTGVAQINRDSVEAITDRLPLCSRSIAAITFVLLFLLTGSVVLPLKALVLNVLSLTAAFGALVWIFQDGPSRRARHHADRHAGRQHAGAVVLHRVRAVDGLRGVPRLPDPGVLADAVRQDPRRQRRGRRPRAGPHRPGDHRRRGGDVDLVRRADRRAGVVHADVRRRPDAGHPGRRHAGPDGAGARLHARAGPVELVGAQTAGPAARTHRHQRVARRPAFRRRTRRERAAISATDTG